MKERDFLDKQIDIQEMETIFLTTLAASGSFCCPPILLRISGYHGVGTIVTTLFRLAHPLSSVYLMFLLVFARPHSSFLFVAE